MTAKRWLQISIPVQGFLLLWQLGTGLNLDRIGDKYFPIIHITGGSLLVTLVVIHVILNWDWVRKTYRGAPKPPVEKRASEE